MLKELRISNFAIIEKQTIFFGKGLNVISGQTGSGKSIILNALELILGARPRAQFIRTGAEQLEVEGLFDIRDLPIEIRESLPDEIATEELLLTRSININGKSKVSINGKPASVSLLQEISQKIINICGQGQHISLLDSKFHLRLVDEYAGNTQILKEYKIKHAYFKELSKAAQEFDNKREVLLREYSELQNLVEELDKVRLSPGIRTELEAQVRKLESAEKIILGMQQIMPGFSAEEGVTAQIAKISAALNSLVRFDPAIKDFIQQLSEMRLNFESLETEVLSYLSSLSLDENKLLLLREELAEIARLERKYRCNDSGLIELLKTSKARLSTLADLNDGKELGKKLQTCREELQAIAHELSKRREISGNTLVKAVEKDLTSLSMPEAKIKVEIEEADFSESGCDLLEFLISTNKGEMFKPLRQIASGGELSRIMLVLKKNLKDRSGVNVLVFDEVDTGISGSVARAVGEKLKNLSAHSQVICITHLAQIASLADIHILVNKEVNDRTISLVKVLQGEEKVDEIARMLAGYEITDATRESAKELLSS